MGTRGQNRTRAVALAGLTFLAVGTAAPAMAEEAGPGNGPTAPATPVQKPAPQPVQDLTPPSRPTLGEATMEAGGTVRLAVQAESGSALVVREGTEVVASVSAIGDSQTLSWRTTTGPHTYLVVATDAAGNVSDPAAIDVEVDATPPAAKAFRVKAGTERNSLSAWSVVTRPGTAYTLLVDGTTLAEGTAEGRRVKQGLDLTDGTHEVLLELRDEVGNLRVLEDSVTVDIPTLWVAAKAVSDAGDTTQVFKIAAPPMTRGFLRIPGAGSERFELTKGRAEVTLEVPEGSYDAPVVIVADSQDRKGTIELEPFEVDLTAPALQVNTTDAAAEKGVFSSTVDAAEGDIVTWELVTGSGLVALSGEFVADGTPQLLERDVAEGSYSFKVTAVDANGNKTVETVDTTIAANPVVNPDVVSALSITAALWVLFGIVVFLRRRGRGGDRSFSSRIVALRPGSKRARLTAERKQAAAEYAEQLAVFEAEDAAWQRRHEALTELVATATGGRGDRSWTAFNRGRKERVLCTVAATLVEMTLQDGIEVPVETAAGELIITDARVAFVGEHEQQVAQHDWELGMLEHFRHIGSDRTFFKMEDDETLSGVAYADAEVTRLYLELARAIQQGTARSMMMMLKQGLRGHELRRPQAPSPVDPSAPERKVAEVVAPVVAPVVVKSAPVVVGQKPAGQAPTEPVEPGMIVVGQQADGAGRSTERKLALLKN
jgi:hypothetical protein